MACRQDPGAGIAAWVRLLLPALIGRPLPDAGSSRSTPAGTARSAGLHADQAAACLSLVDSLLSSKAGGKKKPAKGAISEAVLASCSEGIPAQVCMLGTCTSLVADTAGSGTWLPTGQIALSPPSLQLLMPSFPVRRA